MDAKSTKMLRITDAVTHMLSTLAIYTPNPKANSDYNHVDLYDGRDGKPNERHDSLFKALRYIYT